jgi:hypothetical protein
MVRGKPADAQAPVGLGLLSGTDGQTRQKGLVLLGAARAGENCPLSDELWKWVGERKGLADGGTQ